MPIWKKTIFVNAIRTRVNQEERTKEDIIKEYVKLTKAEKKEILAGV